MRVAFRGIVRALAHFERSFQILDRAEPGLPYGLPPHVVRLW